MGSVFENWADGGEEKVSRQGGRKGDKRGRMDERSDILSGQTALGERRCSGEVARKNGGESAGDIIMEEKVENIEEKIKKNQKNTENSENNRADNNTPKKNNHIKDIEHGFSTTLYSGKVSFLEAKPPSSETLNEEALEDIHISEIPSSPKLEGIPKIGWLTRLLPAILRPTSAELSSPGRISTNLGTCTVVGKGGDFSEGNSTGDFSKGNSTVDFPKENSTGDFSEENSTGNFSKENSGGNFCKENFSKGSSTEDFAGGSSTGDFAKGSSTGEFSKVNLATDFCKGNLSDFSKGFSKEDFCNDLRDDFGKQFGSDEGEKIGGKGINVWIPILAMFASFYNYSVMSIAVPVLKEDDEFAKVIASSQCLYWVLDGLIFAGAIVGQITIGYIGDRVGRRNALKLALCVLSLGSYLSGGIPYGSPVVALYILAAFRCIAGWGAGGTAIISVISLAEGTIERGNRAARMGGMNFVAFVGTLCPYILTACFWYLSGGSVSVCSRLVFVCGGVASNLALVLCQLYLMDYAEFEAERGRFFVRDFFIEFFCDLKYFRRFVATGGCLMIYCFLCWGVISIQPILTREIWGPGEGLYGSLWRSTVLLLMQLPGILVTMALLPRLECKWLLTFGFLVFAFAAFSMGILNSLQANYIVCFIFLGFLNFALVYGAVGTILLLPTLMFPPRCRGTFYGLSACLGKLGATLAVPIFNLVLSFFGIAAVMWLSAAVSLMGALIAVFLIPPPLSHSKPKEALQVALFLKMPAHPPHQCLIYQ